jgi:hypothetical protein
MICQAYGSGDGFIAMSASGRCLPVVTARDFSASATCYVKRDGRVRPEPDALIHPNN